MKKTKKFKVVSSELGLAFCNQKSIEYYRVIDTRLTGYERIIKKFYSRKDAFEFCKQLNNDAV